jgi:hypothetical protein
MYSSLGMAAKATGVSKSTILRAIKAHRISAGKTETGDWQIDPAELHRVFPPERAAEQAVERGATAAMKTGRCRHRSLGCGKSPSCCAPSLTTCALTATHGATKRKQASGSYHRRSGGRGGAGWWDRRCHRGIGLICHSGKRNCPDVSGNSRSSRSRNTLDGFNPRLAQAALTRR